MRFAVLYYVPWYKWAKLNGPWATYATFDGWYFKWYHPTFKPAWKHWLVSIGVGDYEDEETSTGVQP